MPIDKKSGDTCVLSLKLGNESSILKILSYHFISADICLGTPLHAKTIRSSRMHVIVHKQFKLKQPKKTQLHINTQLQECAPIQIAKYQHITCRKSVHKTKKVEKHLEHISRIILRNPSPDTL